MKRLRLTLFLLLMAQAAFAAQPPRDQFFGKLFALRSPTLSAFDEQFASGQSIARYDQATRTFTPFTAFAHRVWRWTDTHVFLSALDDRLLVQGSEYFEFDGASGRLLRRYRAIDPAYNTWAFAGVTISENVAASLGLEPGTYGFPVCPPGNNTTGEGCDPVVQFPQYPPGPARTQFHLLMRRSLDPADRKLHVVKNLGSESLRSRTLALDAARRGFWVWKQETLPESSYKIEVAFVDINQGAIGEETSKKSETFTRDSPYPSKRSFYSTAFGPDADALLTNFSFGGGTTFRVFETNAVTLSETFVEEWTGAPDSFLTGPMTGVPLTAPTKFVQVLPAIGQGPGARDTYWSSDAYFFNPSDSPIAIRVRRVARPDRIVESTIPARASQKITGVLRALGGGPAAEGGDGVITDALVIESPYRWGEQLSVYSRTYTRSQAGGTYGQAVPAVPSSVGYSTHLPEFSDSVDTDSSFSTFILDKRDPQRFRHNLGVVNDHDSPLRVGLRFDVAIPLKPVQPHLENFIEVPPHSVANVNIESLFSSNLFETRPPRLWIAADRPAPVWMSMVDNVSGDATFIPFSLFGILAGDETRMAIPAIAKTPGANDTFWRTDLYGMFLAVDRNEGTQTPRAWFYPAIGSCPAKETRLAGTVGAKEVPDTISTYWHSIFPNLTDQLGCQNADSIRGALEVRIGSWMAGFTRTYTTRADGATFGEMLPFYPAGGWPVQHFAGIDVRNGFRINVGLYNGLSYAVPHRLVLYAADGREVARKELTLAPRESRQDPLFNFFGELPDGVYGLTVLPEDQEARPGRSWAYVSTVDNITGDPTNWW